MNHEQMFPYILDPERNRPVLTTNEGINPLLTEEFFNNHEVVVLPEGMPGILSVTIWHVDNTMSSIELPSVRVPSADKIIIHATFSGCSQGHSFNPYKEFPLERNPYSLSFRMIPQIVEGDAMTDPYDGRAVSPSSQRHPRLGELLSSLITPGGFWQLSELMEKAGSSPIRIMNCLFTIFMDDKTTFFPAMDDETARE